MMIMTKNEKAYPAGSTVPFCGLTAGPKVVGVGSAPTAEPGSDKEKLLESTAGRMNGRG